MSKKIYTFFLFFALAVWLTPVQAQQSALKGTGEVFFTETFDWGNPADEKGWTMPEGYILIDPDDNGYNWMWYKPGDSIVAQYTAEPAFISSTAEDGGLVLPLNLYNDFLDPRLTVNNSLEFPHFDCSSRSSVILRFETHFMNGGDGANEVWVSNDDGVHWAAYDCGFGTLHKDRPNDAAPGKPVVFEANISEVAAGMSDVIIRIHWGETTLYFWVLDDFSLSEAYNNDLQIKHYALEWVDGIDETVESFMHDIPISQIGGTFSNFSASSFNFGELDQDNVTLTVDVSKNNESVFTTSDSRGWISPLVLDTINLEGGYTPEEFGHYKIAWDYTQDQAEENPLDNGAEVFFNVTDSVYSRSDETAELSWAYGFEHYGGEVGEAGWNIEHFCGTIFPIYGDCEVNSISTFITGGLADGKIEFWYTLWWLPPPEEDPEGAGALEWLSTEILTLDSSMFNTWVTLPFEKDGETEFLFAGDIVYAGISYNNYNDEPLVRRGKNLAIGHDASIKVNDPTAIGHHNGSFVQSTFVRGRNLMVRLNLNDQSNIIDGTDLTESNSLLNQNYPNPFAGSTTISYELGSVSDVSIEIKDLTGRQVMVIDEGEKIAGKHFYQLQANKLEAGVYFYTLTAGGFSETKQMVISK
ncbi:MAG: T9SS type A sorting domain-containing protein [Bacteroidetes bacterium]|nr:T9SS type A sorting domain-containing protein [Bacteroidota bacterium]MBT5428195.1 T9SS type A sorting domain-containing protein [Bacteroidota bacterium]